MKMVLAIAEGTWVAIVGISITMAGAALGIFIRNKNKADNADNLIVIKKQIDDDLEPIIKRMDRQDEEYKEYKRAVIEPMKETIDELITKQAVIDVKIDGIGEGIQDIKKLIGKIFDQLDTKKDK
jgi:hypothetical protein